VSPDSQGTILAINAGSSSVKFQLFACTPNLELLAKGDVENIGGSPQFSAKDERTQQQENKALPSDCTDEGALQIILDWIHADGMDLHVLAAVHRIVHGGAVFGKSVLATPAVIEQMRELIPLAPLHQAHNLNAIEIMGRIKPGLAQIACFDTAFHFDHGPLFTQYALPKRVRDQGVRRYGFHGLSYEWIAHRLRQDDPALAEGRVIAAHLGSGASVCGMYKGVSIDSSMGMTALEGLLMGTRCGNLDPGALIYMIRDLGISAEEAEKVLYHESGLLGLSGWTNDVKLLEASDNPDAQFALDFFSLRAAQFMAKMAVALGGVDGIVFTGGIGEHSAFVRNKILSRLEFMKPFKVLVIPANEERIMAMHAAALLETNSAN